MEINMKEWILRYAEQQNEEEKNESSLDDEEKFDPVSRSLNPASSVLGTARHNVDPYLLCFSHFWIGQITLRSNVQTKENNIQVKRWCMVTSKC